MGSEPTPERLLRSRGYFVTGNNRTAEIVTFLDYPLAIAYFDKIISTRQFEAGEKYHQHWYYAGLAGAVPAIQPDKPIVVGGDNFGGMPRSIEEMNHRQYVREAWAAIGGIAGRLIEAGVCWRWPVPWDSPRMQRALNRLADHWNLAKGD